MSSVFRASLAAACLFGCSAAPPPLEKPSEPPPNKLAPAAALPAEAPSRWVESAGTVTFGLTFHGKKVVSLGGRRVLVADDGAVTAPAATFAEPLRAMTRVFTASGEPRLFAVGEQGIYTLDDPLGTPRLVARVPGELRTLGGMPGVLALGFASSLGPFHRESLFLDIDTLKPTRPKGLPDLPVRDVLFRNPREGAAIVDLVGLVWTADGGASWKPIAPLPPQADPELVGDPPYLLGLTPHGDTVAALALAAAAGWWHAPIDFTKGTFTLAPTEPGTTGYAALTQLAAEFPEDPLDTAVSEGAVYAPGEALIARRGMLARVDLRTGMPREGLALARRVTNLIDGCSLARTRDAAYALCAYAAKGAKEAGGFGVAENETAVDVVVRVPLGAAKLTAESELDRPALTFREIKASPRGGVMLTAHATPDLLVRSSAGEWKRIRPRFDLESRGAGPLSDEKVAFIEGLFEEDGLAPGVLHVVVITTAGKEKRLATVPWGNEPSGRIVVQSPFEEAEDGTLRLILADDDGARVVSLTPGDDAAKVTSIPGARYAVLRGKYGVALGPGRLLASTDGGGVWTDLEVPSRVREAMSRVLERLDKSPERSVDSYLLAVTEVGLKVDNQLRVGWGVEESAPPEGTTPSETGSVVTVGSTATPGTKLLTCKTESTSKAGPPVPLEGKPAPKNTRRVAVTNAIALEPSIRLEVDGPEAAGAPPATWSLSWHDPASLGAKRQTASGPAPKGSSRDMWIGPASAVGPRLMVLIRAGGVPFVARTKGASLEITPIENELSPWSTLGAMGFDKEGPIGWIADGGLVLWPEKGPPRRLAELGPTSTVLVGAPAKDGLPFVVFHRDQAWLRTVPEPGSTGAGSASPDLGMWLSGWKPVPSLENVADLPACTAASKGTRMRMHEVQMSLVLDGVRLSGAESVSELLVQPGEACVAKMAFLVRPASGGSSAPHSLVRVNLVDGRAEGGEWEPKSLPRITRKLSCQLSPREGD